MGATCRVWVQHAGYGVDAYLSLRRLEDEGWREEHVEQQTPPVFNGNLLVGAGG